MKNYALLFCLLLAICANSLSTAKAQVDVNDSLTLVDLYKSTNGSRWFNNRNWLTKKPVRTWYGVTVTSSRVTGIGLSGNHLSGVIPSSIGNLVKLQHLLLYRNKIRGTIPSTIGNLVNLITLDLLSNQLSGTIPSTIGNLVKLEDLELFSNQLSGAIPSSIGNLVNLTRMYLQDNQLSGSIPSSIGNLVNLTGLDLGYNQLSGPIPSSIGNLVKLNGLFLHENQLSGAIPFTIGNLVNLVYLYLNNNRLSANIPSSIGNLGKLQYLYLHFNQLSGSIPSSIGNLINLGTLNLGSNQLSGPILSTIGNLVSLMHLYLDHNQLSGGLPPSFLKLEYLYHVDISYNQLSQSSNVEYSSGDPGYQLGSFSNNLFNFNIAEFVAQKFPNIIYAPQAPITIHQHNNTIAVNAGGTLSNNTYNWFKVGAAGSTTIKGDSTFSPVQNGKYYVHVTNDIATQLTLYSDTIDFTKSSSFTAKNRLASDVNGSKIKTVFRVSPNPAKSIVQVQVNSSADIILTNSAGKVMLTKTINNKGEIDVSALSNGVYFIKNTSTGEVQQLIISH